MNSKFTSGTWGPSTTPPSRGGGIVRAVSVLFGSLLIATSAFAGAISAAASRAALAGNDNVQWGSAADDGTTVASPYNRLSAGGVGVTASMLAGDFGVFVQNGGGGYTANFDPNDVVLSTFFSDGPVSITFDQAIRGLGFNVVNDNFGDFTGTLDFYGAGNVLFGSVSVNGTSSAANDGTAPFLGGFSTLRDIVRVDVFVSASSGGSPLSLNQMSLLTTNPPDDGQIPEPTSIALASLALAMAVVSRRRRPGVAIGGLRS